MQRLAFYAATVAGAKVAKLRQRPHPIVDGWYWFDTDWLLEPSTYAVG